MKRIFFLFIPALCLNPGLIAQQQIFQFNVELSPKTDVYASPCVNGDYTYLAIKDKNEMHRFIINLNDGSFKHSKETFEIFHPIYTSNIKILAAITEKDKNTALLYDQEKDRIFVEISNLGETLSTTVDDEIFIKKQTFMAATQWNGQFVFLTLTKRFDKYRIYFKKPGEKFYFKEVDLSFLEFNSETPITEDTYKAQIMDINTINDPKSLSGGIKVFFLPEKIILLCNYRNSFTQIVSIDINDWKTNVKKIPFEEKKIKSKSEIPVSNAFLWNNYLFLAAAYSTGLEVTIRDIINNQVVNKLVSDDDTILFKNTMLKQEGGGFSYSMNRELELKTSQFLRKVRSSYPFIGLKPDSAGRLEMIVGSYLKKESGNRGGHWMGPGSIPTPAGTSPSFTIYIVPGFSASWDKITFFRSLLNKNSFEHIQGSLNPARQEIREDYEDKFLKPRLTIIGKEKININFRSAFKDYTAFYDVKAKAFMIIEFKD